MLQAAPFAEACFETRSGACIPQAGAGAPALDSLADRMMFRAAYRNLGSRGRQTQPSPSGQTPHPSRTAR